MGKLFTLIMLFLSLTMVILAQIIDLEHSKGTGQDAVSMLIPSPAQKKAPEVINGYMLPPEPDETINNSTLLGIDFNENGVRDDVERYIIKRFSTEEYPKTKTAIALQYAWASQKILENPTTESKKHLDDAIDCQFYWLGLKTKDMSSLEAIRYPINHEVFDNTDINDKIYNTRERIERGFQFNQACSGNIFPGRKESLQNCQVNILELGE